MKSPPSWPALYKGAISGICSNPQAAVSAVTELRSAGNTDETGIGRSTAFNRLVKFDANADVR